MRLAACSLQLAARLALAASCLLPAASYAADWQQAKGDHFIVYYASDTDFAKTALRKAETYYTHIADELGYPRVSNFWTWDKRAKIFIYPDEASFHTGTRSPEWMQGVANYRQRSISTFAGSPNFIDGILPHETTHLIFRDFVGFTGQVPLWIDEGVAQWQEPAKRALAKQVARYLVQNGLSTPLAQLTRTDIRKEKDEEAVRDFYMQSVSVVEFMVKRGGAAAFTGFCRGLRDGKPLENALASAYPTSIANLAKLETEWKKYAMQN